MSHEYYIEPSITQTTIDFFYIPDEPSYLRQSFSGLTFEGREYTWDEFDYRLGVEYPGIPEPATTGLLLSFAVALYLMIKQRK
jgi:hypothetical protein